MSTASPSAAAAAADTFTSKTTGKVYHLQPPEHLKDSFFYPDDKNKSIKLYEEVFLPSGLPASEIRAKIVLVAGYGEYTRRYLHFAEFLAKNGFAVYIYDHRGHGWSSGERFFVNCSFDTHVQDLHHVLTTRVPHHFGNPELASKKLFVFGHSMGGMIVIKYGIDKGYENVGVSGVVLSAPSLKLGFTPNFFVQTMAGVIAKVAPRLGVEKPLPSEAMTHCPVALQDRNDDPVLFKGNTCAATGNSFLNCHAYLASRYAKWGNTPVFLLQGTEDKIAHPDGARNFHDTISAEDKMIKLYDGLYHEILHEKEREQIMNDILEWFTQRL